MYLSKENITNHVIHLTSVKFTKKDSLEQHLRRSCYQTYMWKKALRGLLNMPSPNGNGWTIEVEELIPVLMTKDPAPKSVATLAACSCKKTACERKGCKCRVLQMPCCEACVCMGKDDCKNPYCQKMNSDPVFGILTFVYQ